MKQEVKYIFKVALILTFVVFITERIFFKSGFDLTIEEAFKSISFHFMYAITLTFINVFYFFYLEKILPWKTHAKRRLLVGAVGAVVLTMLGLILLRFVTLVVILQRPFSAFFNDIHAPSYYTFGLSITLIITLVFHAIYFYKSLSEKKVEEQQIVAKTETAKYESLKSQIDPHFLFNSLNVLTSLIGENPKQAEKFTTKLSKVYRYVLEQKNKDLVALDEELQFAKTYMELLKMRFENAVTFDIPEKASNENLKIVPLSLQLLLENTIKHNIVSEENPLKVSIKEENGYLIVSNNYNPKNVVGKGTKVGLKNIQERYGLITLKQVRIENDKNNFRVQLPLLTQKTKIMNSTKSSMQNNKYIRAVEKVEEIKGFYSSLLAYAIVIPFLIFINLKYSPMFHWFWFPVLGWGIGLVFQAFKAFTYNPILGKDWEEKKIKEFMEEDKKQYWE